MRLSFWALLATASQVHGALEFERTQLSSEHAKAFSAVDFGRADRGTKERTPRCRAWPGSNDWPSAFEWTLLNATLDGKLLQPAPLTASCYRNHANYNAARCNYILTNATSDDFLINDPVNVLTHWTQGNTCLPAVNATGTCSQGGFPVYVVNATTVKHVQAAVNFARNKNLRLVIKCVLSSSLTLSVANSLPVGTQAMTLVGAPSVPAPSASGLITSKSLSSSGSTARGIIPVRPHTLDRAWKTGSSSTIWSATT